MWFTITPATPLVAYYRCTDCTVSVQGKYAGSSSRVPHRRPTCIRIVFAYSEYRKGEVSTMIHDQAYDHTCMINNTSIHLIYCGHCVVVFNTISLAALAVVANKIRTEISRSDHGIIGSSNSDTGRRKHPRKIGLTSKRSHSSSFLPKITQSWFNEINVKLPGVSRTARLLREALA